MKTTKNYLVFYTKESTPHIKEFKSLVKAKQFVGGFKQDRTDNWVDFIVEGKIVVEYDGANGIVRK